VFFVAFVVKISFGPAALCSLWLKKGCF
jgi:hypothetical protein